MYNKQFWKGRKVFITGHTGFKGSWMSMHLLQLGASITGFALKPPTTPSLYNLSNIEDHLNSIEGDIRDYELLEKSIRECKPEIIIHMAAQPLVRASYLNPIETYTTNVIGTVNILEATRKLEDCKAVINITTDKCYENKEWCWGYRENDRLGGFDPYSNSKACSELVTQAYRDSFFSARGSSAYIASARAGNVIGGGDWAKDRLIPDCMASLAKDQNIVIRNPNSIRPWQHVLEPISGYILLAEKLCSGIDYSGGWNFGPDDTDARSVEWIVKKLIQKWGGSSNYIIEKKDDLHEANYLKLDCSKAKTMLKWYPKWNLEIALDKIIEWNFEYLNGGNVADICIKQIREYMKYGDENGF